MQGVRTKRRESDDGAQLGDCDRPITNVVRHDQSQQYADSYCSPGQTGRVFHHQPTSAVRRRSQATLNTNSTACVDFPNVVAQRHIFVAVPPGGCDSKFELYLPSVPTPKFHHPMFTRPEVIMFTNKQTKTHTHKHTNKQTPLKTSNAVRYATTLGNHLL